MDHALYVRERPPTRLPPVAALQRHRERLAGARLPAEPAAEGAVPATLWAVAVGPWQLLFDPALGCELLEAQQPAFLPGTPAWLPGAVNLRGALVPVFDPALLEGAGGSAAGEGLLAVGTGEATAVLRVRGMPFRQDPDGLGPPSPLPELPSVLAGAVARAWCAADGIWLDCDLPGLFEALGARAGSA